MFSPGYRFNLLGNIVCHSVRVLQVLFVQVLMVFQGSLIESWWSASLMVKWSKNFLHPLSQSAL